jgi:hypothetical protein
MERITNKSVLGMLERGAWLPREKCVEVYRRLYEMENEQEKTKEAEIIEAKPKRNYQKKGEQK